MNNLRLETIAPNFTRLTTQNGIIWFSYETPIAYADHVGEAVVSKNAWGSMTGNHIDKVEFERGRAGSRVDANLFASWVQDRA